jgi:hypothetical protein
MIRLSGGELIEQLRSPTRDLQIADGFFHYHGRLAGLPLGPIGLEIVVSQYGQQFAEGPILTIQLQQ